jgi:hypothetical protein
LSATRGSSAEQRLAARSTRIAPLMAALNARLTAMVGQLFSQLKLAEAINYALNHEHGLTLFPRDGRIEVDSNTVERSMRIAMRRRSSLFGGSEGPDPLRPRRLTLPTWEPIPITVKPRRPATLGAPAEAR